MVVMECGQGKKYRQDSVLVILLIFISAAFRLHNHELFEESQAGNAEFVSRAKIALQSLARIIIHATKAANTGRKDIL